MALSTRVSSLDGRSVRLFESERTSTKKEYILPVLGIPLRGATIQASSADLPKVFVSTTSDSDRSANILFSSGVLSSGALSATPDVFHSSSSDRNCILYSSSYRRPGTSTRVLRARPVSRSSSRKFTVSDIEILRKSLRVSKESPFLRRFVSFLQERRLSGSTFSGVKQHLARATEMLMITPKGEVTLRVLDMQQSFRKDEVVALTKDSIGEEWKALLEGASSVIAFQGQGPQGQFVQVQREEFIDYVRLKDKGNQAEIERHPINRLIEKGPLRAVATLTPSKSFSSCEASDALGDVYVGSNAPRRRTVLEGIQLAFPDLLIEKKLGQGSFATAMKVQSPEGPQVLRLLNLSRAFLGKNARRITHLTPDRVGGEWLAFLLQGANCVSTQEIFAYQKESQRFFRFSRQEFLEYLDLKEKARAGGKGELLALARSRIHQALQKEPLVAVGTLSDLHEGAVDLKEVLRKRSVPLPAKQFREYAYQITKGLAEIHEVVVDGKRLVHRDVKPDNILLTTGGRVLQFDTGLSRLIPEGAKRLSKVGSPIYSAPERFFTDGDYDEKFDGYSLFVTLFRLAALEYPHDAQTIPQLMGILKRFGQDQKNQTLEEQWAWMKMDLQDNGSPLAEDEDFVDLLVRLSQVDPTRRMSVRDAFANHPFFVKMRAQKKS